MVKIDFLFLFFFFFPHHTVRFLSDDDLRQALQYLESFYVQNSVNDRRNLRTALEKRTLETHYKFFEEFSKVNQQLESIQQTVSLLESTCVDVLKKIRETKQETDPFLNEALQLNQQLYVKFQRGEGGIYWCCYWFRSRSSDRSLHPLALPSLPFPIEMIHFFGRNSLPISLKTTSSRKRSSRFC